MRGQSICLFGRVLIPAIIALLFGATDVWAEKRVALVIGNGAYQKVPALATPANDAGDIAGSLTRLGFTVKTLTDARREDIQRGLTEFGREASGAEIALFYFAGRGVEIRGKNWLAPVDAELRSENDADKEAIDLEAALTEVSRGSKLAIVILDASRENPFELKLPRTGAIQVRPVTKGLARTPSPDNVVIAYSTGVGRTAKEGSGRNSPFTAALLNNLEKPGLEMTVLFRNVRDEVASATNSEQIPFFYGSFSTKAIYLKNPPAAPAGPAVPKRP